MMRFIAAKKRHQASLLFRMQNKKIIKKNSDRKSGKCSDCDPTMYLN